MNFSEIEGDDVLGFMVAYVKPACDAIVMTNKATFINQIVRKRIRGFIWTRIEPYISSLCKEVE